MKEYFKLLSHIRDYKGNVALNVLFNILSVIFSLFSLSMIAPFLNVLFNQEKQHVIQPWTLSPKTLLNNLNCFFADYIKDHGVVETLAMISGSIIVLFLLKNLFRYLAQFFIAPVRNGIVRDLRNMMYGKILDLPLSYFSNERKGDLITRMSSDVMEIEWGIFQSLEAMFREPITVLLFFSTMMVMSPQLTLIVLIILPIAGFLIGVIGSSLRKTSAKAMQQMGLLVSTIEETLGGLRIIKGFAAEFFSKNKFSKINDKHKRLVTQALRKRDLSSPMSEFLAASAFAVVLYYGGKLALTGVHELEAATFIAYIAIFAQLIPPAKAFTDAYYNAQKGMASVERINKILNAEITIHDKATPIHIKDFNHSIEYRSVSFAYIQGDKGWALKNFSLKIEKGRTIALVGQSGSGKTTIADLLPRFYDPDNGEILLDGENIKDYKLSELRRQMGIVTQESILFNDTVFNNIAFGIEGATEDDVIQAARIANAHDFILQMPDGYQTNIGDRGSKMSGGQRQRISIARAVLKNPPILILDEATSALDTESERLVQDALTRLMENRTTLVIAHRLSTIQHADNIVVLKKGEIIECGKHSELLALNGEYKKLYDLQMFV